MYQLSDTIVAVSSPSSEQRVIIRITGPETIGLLAQIFSPLIPKDRCGIMQGIVTITPELKSDATLYLFLAPHSYTGDDVAELHIYTNSSVTETLITNLLANGLRMAGPGEFTARSYLAGKIDLAQAEAVNEIITSSNRLQLAAAEKLLSGRLAQTTAKVRSCLMECLSLIEAGLDFSGEDIEFISPAEAMERLVAIKTDLEHLLAGSISYESVIDLPAVGIAGAPNAGKSSLLNKLLGRQRSIISAQRKTTRDILTGRLMLTHCSCVLFDCAGLTAEPDNIIDELAQQAAVEALNHACVVVFCVDVSKTDWTEDVSIRRLIKPLAMIPVATKSDLLSQNTLAGRLAEIKKLFAADFLPVSVKTAATTEHLKKTIDEKIIAQRLAGAAGRTTDTHNGVALTSRHRQAVTESISNITESIEELKTGNTEVAAMLLRAAYQAVSDIERHNIDEQILEGIFRRFCIGK
jgi:tRNA modification GTPase